MASNEFFFDFEPKYFELPNAVAEILNDVTFENLGELAKLDEIEGLTIIRYDGKQPLIFSPVESRFNYLKTLGKIITSLEPSSYFKDLSKNFEYKGTGHLSFDDFDLFLIKIAKNLLLVIMANDPSSRLFRIAQTFGDELFEIFHQFEVHSKGDETSLTQEISSEPEPPSFKRFQFSSHDNKDKPNKIRIPTKNQLKDSLRERLNNMKDKQK
ncbi:MAG: hypothetical protein HeimC2_25040 [Candidatus Heimdallarchaeota archaeon LC_2]|nr:MAG: hypothetical protein HeimC2_25040 [Candidatus Heimdallarchaeota archaeon LC_2]